MAIEFRIKPHSVIPGRQTVEILMDGGVVGAIYPWEEDGIRVISAHFEMVETEKGFEGEVSIDRGGASFPPIPAVQIKLDPKGWYITEGGQREKMEGGSNGG